MKPGWRCTQVGVSAILRVVCSIASFRLKESKGSSPTKMLTDVLGEPNLHLRFLRFPVGLDKGD